MKIGRREIPGSIAVFIRGWVARRAGTIAGRLERGSQRYAAQPFLKDMRQGAPPSIAIFAPDALRSSARVWSCYFRTWPCAPPTGLPPRRRYRRRRFAIRAPPPSGEAIDRRHRSRGADFQTRRRHDRTIDSDRDRSFAVCVCGRLLRDSAFPAHDGPGDCRDPARALQPSAPRRRPRNRLPVLSQRCRDFRGRRRAADRDLHDLPFADLDQRRDPRTGPPKPRFGDAPPLAPGQSIAGLCLFRSQRSHRQGGRLHDLPWRYRTHAVDAAGGRR